MLIVVVTGLIFFSFMLFSYLAAFATFHGDTHSTFNPWEKIY